MEEDCDRRVIRHRPWSDARRYGELLVDVGARVGPGASLAPAAFAEGGSHLERRLRTMFELYPPLSRIRTILATAGALGLAAAVFFLPGPDRAALLGPDEAETADEAATDARFTPFTRAPELLNPLEVRDALQAEYPPLLRDAGIGGTVDVWIYVDDDGLPTDTRIDESSGHRALDAAALEVVSIMRFRPAADGDRPVAAWLSIPLRFTDADGTAEAARPERIEIPPPAEPDDDLSARPRFTPYSVAPDLTNRSEIQQALEAAYPPALRDERIGGTTRVWFFIDEQGRVQDTRIESSSGHPALDEAALKVAAEMEFTPALNRDQPVPVWVAFPITFQVR